MSAPALRRDAGKQRGGKHNETRPHALKVSLLPVDVLITLSGICARASSRKFRPLQCIGMITSGSSFLISATTCLR